MRLLQAKADKNFNNVLAGWAKEIEVSNKAAVIHMYVPYNLPDVEIRIEALIADISRYLPEVPMAGTTSVGQTLYGKMKNKDIIVTLTLFEEESTHVEVFYTYKYNRNLDDARKFRDYLAGISDLKGLEIFTSAEYDRLQSVGSILDELSEELEIFGAVAVGDAKNPAYVFTDVFEQVRSATVFIIYSGKDLHIQTNRMFGWSSIGYPLEVTKVEGPVVYEIDSKPAYDVYNHYISIPQDDDFFYNALVFPWEIEVDKDTRYIRHAKSVNPDGSIVMSSFIPQGSKIRISYGDPRRIISSTKLAEAQIIDFAPQVVRVYNCMGRMLFWGQQAEIEVEEVSKYVNVTGFSALGEIMRYKQCTILNNLSIVSACMREGEISDTGRIHINNRIEKQNMPITARLAYFINVITEELLQKNEELNEMIYNVSHDALTGLFNRGTIERMIYDNHDISEVKQWHLIMADIDDFKMINDTYGHQEGDKALKAMASYLSYQTMPLENISVGRWGGEEFMILLSNYTDGEVQVIARNICDRLPSIPVKLARPMSVSVGVTAHRSDENVNSTILRVDELLYEAKRNGKNQVCTDLK
ncbi:MAG: GGDEF domain-containing protein [Lachnospiraceae bacterium]|nr:GGDEF domain-containing protein [Lachnospiraceae bacterium]